MGRCNAVATIKELRSGTHLCERKSRHVGPPSHPHPPLSDFAFHYLSFSLLGESQLPSRPFLSLYCFTAEFFPKKIVSLMQNSGIPGGGGGSGQISRGSMSTLSREVVSSEESSSYPDENGLELGLGLSLCCGGKSTNKLSPATVRGSWDQYARARILTAKDFVAVVSAKDSSSSSSAASVTKAKNNGCCGTKRTAEPQSPPGGRAGVSQVVGWPPIRNYRLNSLANNAKTPAVEEFSSTVDKCKSRNGGVDKSSHGVSKEKGLVKTTLYVKVNMEGIPIGRKVDLNAHSCYEALARTLDNMFMSGSNVDEQAVMGGTRRSTRLLDGASDFVMIYEDKEGDWMLVGDVPWEMFLSSVRRLRIVRTAEANGLAPGTLLKGGRGGNGKHESDV